MTYKRFEDLPVWGSAIEHAVDLFAFTATGCLKGYSGLKDQIERAVVSISNNIAEGFERGTHEELMSFLYIARGSTGEVRSMLALLARLPELAEHHARIRALRAKSDDISRQLNAWIESLKHGPKLGPRARSAASRAMDERKARAASFLEELRRISGQNPSSNGPTSPHPSEDDRRDPTE